MRRLLFLAILIPTSLLATPDDGIRIFEVLLGYNSSSYYSIQTIHYPTGIYYEMIDSSFVVERKLSSGEITDKVLLRSATHIDKSTFEDWETNEYLNKKFDFPSYLIDKEIKYLYPEIYPNYRYRPFRFGIGAKGLWIYYRDFSDLVLGIDSVEKFIPSIKETFEAQRKLRERFPKSRDKFVEILDFVGDSKYWFFIVESKHEPEYSQSIIVIPSDHLYSVRNNLINQRN